MRSWQLVEFDKPLRAQDAATPQPAGTEVLVRIAACGLCHSDLHLWEGQWAASTPLPLTMGHEMAGTVVALGPDATGVAIGDRRIVFPWLGCGQCALCLSGEEHFCTGARASLGTKRPGGFSDYVIVPHARYLVDHAGVPEALAGTYACSGVSAYSALKKVADCKDGDWILVIGAGGVGLSAVGIAPAVTRARIAVADIDPAKRAAALQAGAAAAIDNGTPEGLRQIRDLSQGGVHATIDFVGRPETAQFGIDALRRAGTLVLVGLHGGTLGLPLAAIPPRMLTIRGSQVGSLAEMHELMALVKAGRIPPIPVETRAMSRATESLEDLRAGRIPGRVVLLPDGG